MSEADARLSASMQGIAAESGRATGSAMKGAGGDQDGGMTELYKVNQLYYRMLPTLSLVAKRTLLVNAAQHSQYSGTGQSIQFIFNSGEYYISCPTSYLYIRCGYNAPAQFGNSKAVLSQGNIMSIFDEVVFSSASGTEVCREQNKGLHSSYTGRYNNTQEYLDTIGAVQGWSSGPYFRNQDGVAPVFRSIGTSTAGALNQLQSNLNATFPMLGGTEGLTLPRCGPEALNWFGYSSTNLNNCDKSVVAASGLDNFGNKAVQYQGFIVPLDQLCGLFKPYLSTLMPAGMLAGGRLELRFKDLIEALQFMGPCIEDSARVGGTGYLPPYLGQLITQCNSGFQVDACYLVLDAYQLQDNVLKKLNAVSAGTDGLNFLFDTYDHVTSSFAGTGTFEAMISQARSRIIRSWNIVRDSSNLLNPYLNSYAAEAASNRVCAKIGPGYTIAANSALTPITFANSGNTSGVGGYMIRAMTATNAIWQMNFGGGAQSEWPLQMIPFLPADGIASGSYGLPTVRNFQSVLGALYFPQQPITTLDEHYQNALYIMGKGVPDKDNTCSVTREDFLGGLGTGIYNAGNNVNPQLNVSYGTWVAPYGLAIYGFVAEKNQALNLSGLPISNARLLRHKFNFQFPTLSGQPRVITTFTQFTRVAKVFLGGRVVVRE
jgi:hypothetical protein